MSSSFIINFTILHGRAFTCSSSNPPQRMIHGRLSFARPLARIHSQCRLAKGRQVLPLCYARPAKPNLRISPKQTGYVSELCERVRMHGYLGYLAIHLLLPRSEGLETLHPHHHHHPSTSVEWSSPHGVASLPSSRDIAKEDKQVLPTIVPRESGLVVRPCPCQILQGLRPKRPNIAPPSILIA